MLAFNKQQIGGVAYCNVNLMREAGRSSDTIRRATIYCARSERLRTCRELLHHAPDEGLVFVVYHALPCDG
jgi:hypothetical protein